MPSTAPYAAPLIGIVVGETSGDELGAGLVRALRQRLPDARFVGVAGPAMLAEGVESLAPMERLAVMGIAEPLKRLPELLAIRKRIKAFFVDNRPAIFIGIDAPDFNLPIARFLRRRGVKTCHYVCPSVWAWRQGRVVGIRASVDHVLALLPFEVEFLQAHGIPSTFVGHPLADRLRQTPMTRAEARTSLKDKSAAGVGTDTPILCVMPGSRNSELERLLETFLQTLRRCFASMPEMRAIIPAATPALHARITARLTQPDCSDIENKITVLDGSSMTAMIAADVVLLASGTATLEAALLQRPMVVAYKLSPVTYAIAKHLVKTPYVALPNLLTNTPMVPEFIQGEANAEELSAAILHLFENDSDRQAVVDSFSELGAKLARDADVGAADAVISLLAADQSSTQAARSREQ